MTSKERLHQLIDPLPESELGAAEHFLEALCKGDDLLLRVLEEAPEDDEPTTPEEDAGAEEAWQEHLRGESISAEEAKRLLLS